MNAGTSTPLTLHVFERPHRVVFHQQPSDLDEITDFTDEDTVWAAAPPSPLTGPVSSRPDPRAAEATTAFRVTLLAVGFVFGGGFAVVTAGLVTLGAAVVGGAAWLAA